MRDRYPSVLVLMVMVVAGACASDPAPETPTAAAPSADPGRVIEATHAVRFGGGARLSVAVADDDVERARGLMSIAGLPDSVGMAFTYDSPSTGTFWMKDTLIPLSIAFVGEDGRIVTILVMEPCQASPCPLYGADAPYTMAIEANAGWFDANGVSVGDTASLEMPP